MQRDSQGPAALSEETALIKTLTRTAAIHYLSIHMKLRHVKSISIHQLDFLLNIYFT